MSIALLLHSDDMFAYIILRIDGLSLAMFEALRGLRDAATVEGEHSSESTSIDDVANANRTDDGTGLRNDSELVQKLVDAVFEKSYAIDAILDNNYTTPNNVKIPPLYTNRTKAQQLEYIEELVKENNEVIQELYTVVQETIQQRNLCRQYIINNSDLILFPLQQFDTDLMPDVTPDTTTAAER